jgi:hypothetical protein
MIVKIVKLCGSKTKVLNCTENKGVIKMLKTAIGQKNILSFRFHH